MIVCQCNVISERDIENAVLELLDQDEWRVIVPNQVYHLLGKRGRCCGCFPNTGEIITRTVDAYHQRRASPAAAVVPFRARRRERRAEDEAPRRQSGPGTGSQKAG